MARTVRDETYPQHALLADMKRRGKALADHMRAGQRDRRHVTHTKANLTRDLRWAINEGLDHSETTHGPIVRPPKKDVTIWAQYVAGRALEYVGRGDAKDLRETSIQAFIDAYRKGVAIGRGNRDLMDMVVLPEVADPQRSVPRAYVDRIKDIAMIDAESDASGSLLILIARVTPFGTGNFVPYTFSRTEEKNVGLRYKRPNFDEPVFAPKVIDVLAQRGFIDCREATNEDGDTEIHAIFLPLGMRAALLLFLQTVFEKRNFQEAGRDTYPLGFFSYFYDPDWTRDEDAVRKLRALMKKLQAQAKGLSEGNAAPC